MFKKYARNPFLLFFPFLVFYCYFITINKWPKLYGDELRYWGFAKNLLHGFYSPPMPHINLWNGPGYPLFLVPFLALHIPAIYITLTNALFLYLAIVFLHKSLLKIANFKIATIAGVLLAIYPNTLAILPILYTEAVSIFLISAFVYTLITYNINHQKKYSIIAGLILGYIVLTKIIFGYVILIGLLIFLIRLIFKKTWKAHFRSVSILLIAFLVTIPYLLYTYKLTNKVFYWGNSGGMSLYWMTSPYDNEYGDWKLPDLSNNQYPKLFPSSEVAAILKKNHNKELSFIFKHNELQQDELFKNAAFKNIKKSPIKYINNYLANCSRMLFNFPYSYAYQDAAIIRNILTGSLIIWGSIIGLVITLINWRKLIFPIKFVLLITVVYFSLSATLSAYPRQLDIMVPVLLLWIGYLAGNLKLMSLKFVD